MRKNILKPALPRRLFLPGLAPRDVIAWFPTTVSQVHASVHLFYFHIKIIHARCEVTNYPRGISSSHMLTLGANDRPKMPI